MYTGLWWRNLRETDHLEDPDVGGSICKMDLQEVGYVSIDWIDLAQKRDRGRTVVYAVMNLRVL